MRPAGSSSGELRVDASRLGNWARLLVNVALRGSGFHEN